MKLVMQAVEVMTFLQEVFPQLEGSFSIEHLANGGITAQMSVGQQHLRPGGTVSGPTLFALADFTVYALVLAHVGPKALAVTTNATIDFMRKPEAGKDIVAEGKLLKLGRTLAVGDVLIYSKGMDKPVARSSMTYSLPPKS